MTRLFAIFFLLLAPAWPALIDRIAIVVDGHVIKDSDIEREIRITDFLNGERLSFGPAERKHAAQRLIDQALIRREIAAGRYPEATEQETAALFQQAVKSKQPPASYGLTEVQLRRALHWQLTVLRFIDLRFKPQTRLGVKDPFETWLDQARQAVRIDYHEEDLK